MLMITATRFICDCGFQDKALDGRDLMVAIQRHLSVDHHKWPTADAIEFNPSKWGITLTNMKGNRNG